ncbi:Sigma non-opioid intracellular receptor 1 [Strongyloides ratti]|uniref:Sigma non-opioid intracellular receptor 1 n=1 Tax=Strongyloides ratti TaxID=34506 RepID=A0A090MSM0_STRRB|nr:Sigma non-opioid intracellular receptor 1 [Strongyloides ratti]CEF61263.1 Sigma non-opioid intracellular receptor 1 [Strongyloides ratti]
MAFILSRLIRFVLLIFVVYQIVQYVLHNKTYSFPASKFKKVALEASKMKNGLSATNNFISNMKALNPQNSVRDAYWIPFSAGGLNLNAQFTSTLLTEFSVVFHAPLKTSGRSGIHWSNTSCSVLSGTVYRSKDILNGGFKEIFKKGEEFRHGQFEGAIYEFLEDTFIACYGRGVIPLSGIYPTIGGLLNSDPVSVGKLFIIYVRGITDSYLFYLQSIFNQIKNSITKTEL